MIGTFGPAADRSCDAIDVTLVLIVVTAVPTQVIGLLMRAQGTTSLPPIVTVISPTWPGCAAMKAVAAAICVVVG